jgi:hypothetical protein
MAQFIKSLLLMQIFPYGQNGKEYFLEIFFVKKNRLPEPIRVACSVNGQPSSNLYKINNPNQSNTPQYNCIR